MHDGCFYVYASPTLSAQARGGAGGHAVLDGISVFCHHCCVACLTVLPIAVTVYLGPRPLALPQTGCYHKVVRVGDCCGLVVVFALVVAVSVRAAVLVLVVLDLVVAVLVVVVVLVV